MIQSGWRRSTGGLGAALAAVALSGALAACGGSGTASGTPSNTAATEAASQAPAPPSSTTGATSSAKKGGTAAPGTKLSVGQSAKLPFAPAGSTGSSKASTLLITVKSFDKGSLSDFNGISLDAGEKAGTPYYVKVHVTNLGPHAIDVDSSAAAIEGVDSTGNNQSSVTFIGDFPRCPDAASTKPLGTGKGYDDCLTFLVPGGIKKVSYNGTSDYIDSPVTWAPR